MSLFLTLCLLVITQTEPPKPATVYFYRAPYHKTFVRIAPPVYVQKEGDAKRVKLASLPDGRFFGVSLESGKYSFTSDSKNDYPAVLEVRAGEIYYVRMEMRIGAMMARGYLVPVDKEQGTNAVKQAKAIEARDVKDSTQVTRDGPP
jgi:hypothetical protein